MRRWIGRLGRLYPRPWRARYGEEFDALLADVEPDWKEFFNVAGGALKMQMKDSAGGLQWIAAVAAVGVVAALAVSFAASPRYVSSAVLRATPQRIWDSTTQVAPGRVSELAEDLASSASLRETVLHFDLYDSERARVPMEEIVKQMRTRDLRIEPLSRRAGVYAYAFRISFAYPDAERAQLVVQGMVARLMEQNMRWLSRARVAGGDMESLELLDPASLPATAIRPNRLVFLAWGLGAGLAIGVLTLLLGRRPKAVLQLAAWAAGGCLAAAGLSYAIPDRFTSTAVMRLHGERMQRMKREFLADDNLERMILTPQLDLYHQQRSGKPLKEVVAEMRKDLSVEFVKGLLSEGARPSVFAISFSYSDRYKAQSVVRTITAEFIERFVEETRAAAEADARLGEDLKVVDPASLPETPVAPNRLALAGSGTALGLLLGYAALQTRRRRMESATA